MKFLIILFFPLIALADFESGMRQLLGGIRCDPINENGDEFSRACKSEVREKKLKDVKVPKEIFKKFNALEGLTHEGCTRLWAERWTHRPTGKIYTIVGTAEDSCDGGNSYGLVFKGAKLRLDKVVRVHQDGTFYTPESSHWRWNGMLSQ